MSVSLAAGSTWWRSSTGANVMPWPGKRLHQALDYQTPAEVYFQTATARQKQTTVIKLTLVAKGKGGALNEILFCLDFRAHLRRCVRRRCPSALSCAWRPAVFGEA